MSAGNLVGCPSKMRVRGGLVGSVGFLMMGNRRESPRESEDRIIHIRHGKKVRKPFWYGMVVRQAPFPTPTPTHAAGREKERWIPPPTRRVCCCVSQELYKTVWEIKQRVVIDMAADRGAFICQSQSMNVHMAEPTQVRVWSTPTAGGCAAEKY